MTAIVGGQAASGTKLAGKVEVNLTVNQNYTVPANHWFEGHVWTNNSSVYAEVGGGWQVDVPYSVANSGEKLGGSLGLTKLGPGQGITCRGTNYLIIRGVLFTNEG